MEFIFERLKHRNADGSLQIMYTIHGTIFRIRCGVVTFKSFALGDKDLEEIELTHLDGHKGSKPVR